MQKDNRLLYSLAFVKLILPFLLQSPLYEPHRDEFLYLAEGRHMAWGFMEVPPLLSVFAWLTNLFGEGMFWIKFWPSLFGSLTYIIAGKIILSFGGRSFALFLAFLPFIFGVYLRLFYLFQPNFLEVFFWTMLAYSTIRYIQTAKNKWLYIFGISAGLGMMSKYSIAFFIVSVAAGLLFTPQRKILFNKHFWYAAIIGFLILLPNILWQFQNHLPVVFHMRELQQTQLQYVDTPGFLIDQVLMNLPCVFVWMAGFWFAAFTKQGRPYRFAAWAYIFVIILLIVLHGKNYYSIGVYPMLLAFGSFHLEQFTLDRKYLRYVFVLLIFILGLPLVPAALPVASPEKLDHYYNTMKFSRTNLLKWEDLQYHPLPQDFSDMLGWEEMIQKVATAYKRLNNAEKQHTILFCDNYGQAGAANFYAKKYHLPYAYSDNASFLYWLPDSMHIDNIILVTDDQQEMQHDFIKDFQYAAVNDSVTNAYARERGSLIITLKGANEAFNQMFKEKIKDDKAQFKY
ncbi:MAG TPA: glycosyltransferase family 39 protein [Chitinophagaceae bacterium]